MIHLATGTNHFIMPQVGDMDQKQETSNSRLLQDTWLDIKLYLDFFCFNLKHVYEEKPFQKATNNNAIFCLMSQTQCLYLLELQTKVREDFTITKKCLNMKALSTRRMPFSVIVKYSRGFV